MTSVTGIKSSEIVNCATNLLKLSFLVFIELMFFSCFSKPIIDKRMSRIIVFVKEELKSNSKEHETENNREIIKFLKRGFKFLK